MTLPRIATRDEWLAARTALLAEEKELTRRRDALNAKRRELPMVEIDKDYALEGPQGTVGLLDLFDGRRQLDRLPLHVRPDLGGRLLQLLGGHRRAVTRLLRAPAHPRHELRHGVAGTAGQARALEAQEGLGRALVLVVRQRLQLRLRRHDRRVGGVGRVQLPHAGRVRGPRRGRLRPSSRSRCRAAAASCRSTAGCSTPTRSTPAGLESTGGSYYFLDLTALGRQEEWEEPKGRSESARVGTARLRHADRRATGPGRTGSVAVSRGA